jgi:hypothetical protein
LYVVEPGRASVPDTLRASCCQSADVGAVLEALFEEALFEEARPLGDTGGAGESCGGWASSGVQATATAATPPRTRPRRPTRPSTSLPTSPPTSHSVGTYRSFQGCVGLGVPVI